MTPIKTATTDAEILDCWEAMYALRPMLQKETFVAQIKQQQGEGYQLIYIAQNGKVLSVAGYRFFTMLYSGKFLYVDDLSTLETARGKGHASMLLNYIYKIAQEENCKSVHLDSGHLRTTAHKLYLKEDFNISAFHFSKSLV